jgi:hypothetical protein
MPIQKADDIVVIVLAYPACCPIYARDKALWDTVSPVDKCYFYKVARCRLL